MKSHAAFILDIPKPCSQDWENMTASDGGKYCDYCQKTVVDFSAMSDKELVSYLNNSRNSICARVPHTQLKRLIETEQPGKQRLWPSLFATGLLLGLSESAVGQSPKQKNTLSDTLIVQSQQSTITEIRNGYPDFPPIDMQISGQLVDDKKNPIVNADVQLLSEEMELELLKTTTDFDGNYLLIGKVNMPAGSALTVRFSYMWQDTTITGIHVQPVPAIVNAVLNEHERNTFINYVGGLSYRPITRWQRVKMRIRRLFR